MCTQLRIKHPLTSQPSQLQSERSPHSHILCKVETYLAHPGPALQLTDIMHTPKDQLICPRFLCSSTVLTSCFPGLFILRSLPNVSFSRKHDSSDIILCEGKLGIKFSGYQRVLISKELSSRAGRGRGYHCIKHSC